MLLSPACGSRLPNLLLRLLCHSTICHPGALDDLKKVLMRPLLPSPECLPIRSAENLKIHVHPERPKFRGTGYTIGTLGLQDFNIPHERYKNHVKVFENYDHDNYQLDSLQKKRRTKRSPDACNCGKAHFAFSPSVQIA